MNKPCDFSVNLDENSRYNIKLLVIGDKGVGKTTILFKFKENKFYEFPPPTCGVDLYTQDISQKAIQFYDCSGSTRFQSILAPFYKSVDGIILVYSILSVESFLGIKRWLKMVSQHCQNENVQMVLIGNKKDMSEIRKVDYQEGKRLAEQLECPFYETSAKTEECKNETVEQEEKEDHKKKSNIKKAILGVCENIVEHYNRSYYYKKDSIWIRRQNIEFERINQKWSFYEFGKSLISCL